MITLHDYYICDGKKTWRSIYKTFCKNASNVADKYFEVKDVTLAMHPILDRFAIFKNGHFNMHKAAGLFEWYATGSKDSELIEQYLPIFKRNKNACSPYYNSNYGYYLFTENQLLKAAKMLIDDKHTRRAQIVINSSNVLHNDNFTDKLCTNYIHFYIANSSLHMYVDMRSSDLYNLLPYDVCMFSIIYEMMYLLLQYSGTVGKLLVGTFTLHAMSLHIYADDLLKAKDMYASKYVNHKAEDFNAALRANTNGRIVSVKDFLNTYILSV